MSERNSRRSAPSLRNTPRITLLVIFEALSFTPRQCMAWFHPEWYHRIVSYSGTYVNQQWPFNPANPGGAWDYHQSLIAGSAKKPIRIWMHVGDRDLFNPNVMRDDMSAALFSAPAPSGTLTEKASAEKSPVGVYQSSVLPILEDHCYECHAERRWPEAQQCGQTRAFHR